ncbi:carotenoid oxygenase [Laetiporus sulphureus 93-53]|uniref:Carotenoid oxygenase n=1 Tax=Laetiporus sulphureus 93-53 TaxID=1314785 RepID=A0A165EF33_9APHY|nr:carotenoid oxygenase [Laetiporus sulphureus 93-53]KZT06918.1 carotenoid oxygenase [Laetiporus sulphureus 93-53]
MASCAAGFENAPEQRTPIDLDIHGSMPPWLSGVLYRTGPGTTRIPTTADPSKTVDIQHWFDGLAMHHRFEIYPGGQRVSYRSHKGAEDFEKRIADAGSYPGFSFGQKGDPCQGIFRKFFTVFRTLRDMNVPAMQTPSGQSVSVTLTPDMPGWKVDHLNLPSPSSGPRYLVAKTDADILQLLDPITLEPLVGATYKDLDPRLDGPLSAAHSCRDHETGDFYNYSCKIGGRFPTYKIFRISGKDGKVDILAEVKDAPPSYIHSFAMTERFVILCVWQAHITQYGMSLVLNKNVAESIDYNWNPKADTLFYVVDRNNGGLVGKYKTPPFFCFHHLNAFDDPDTGDIVIDMSVYSDNNVINLLYLDKLRNLNMENHMLMGRARRFRLPSPARSSAALQVQDAIVDLTLPQPQSIELPVVAPSVYHKPYRFAYGINKLDPKLHHTFADGIIKLDMASSSDGTPGSGTKVWRKPAHTPSEPIFVPRPGGTSEDDGVLLSVVLDEDAMRSSMVVLDAKEMTELARAEMKTVFPIGFHGVFAAQKL